MKGKFSFVLARLEIELECAEIEMLGEGTYQEHQKCRTAFVFYWNRWFYLSLKNSQLQTELLSLIYLRMIGLFSQSKIR